MAGWPHRNVSYKKIASELARYSTTSGDHGNRRPLGEGRSFCRIGFTECPQSSRHKFSVKSRACGLQTHPHRATDRLRFRSALARPLDRHDQSRILRRSCSLDALPSVITNGRLWRNTVGQCVVMESGVVPQTEPTTVLFSRLRYAVFLAGGKVFP
jgi:hypothetical protein